MSTLDMLLGESSTAEDRAIAEELLARAPLFQPIGYKRDGSPIYPVQGGATMWRKPAIPLWSGPGTNVTAAALTSGLAGNPATELPAIDPVDVAYAKMYIEAVGEITSTSATPTVVLGFYIGTVNQVIGSKTVVAVSAAMAISASATAWPFHMRWLGNWRALGNGGAQIHGMGILDWWGNVGLTGTGTQNPMPTTAAARTVSSLSSKQFNELDLGVTLSVTTGSPTVTITQFHGGLEG